MSQLSTTIRVACVMAFLSVAFSAFAPSFVCAADAPAGQASSLPAGTVAQIKGATIQQ